VNCSVFDTNTEYVFKHASSSSSSSSSIGATAHCGLWSVEQCPSVFSYLPTTLFIFSLSALEDFNHASPRHKLCTNLQLELK